MNNDHHKFNYCQKIIIIMEIIKGMSFVWFSNAVNLAFVLSIISKLVIQ